MGKASTTLLIAYVFLTALAMSSADASSEREWGWVRNEARCQGSMAQCTFEDEFGMDNEINRRILATKNYISYEALKQNSVPCSKRGASYYNCKTVAEANPYQQGCSEITHCRTD